MLEDIIKKFKIKIGTKILYLNIGLVKKTTYDLKLKTYLKIYDNYINKIDYQMGYNQIKNILEELRNELKGMGNY